MRRSCGAPTYLDVCEIEVEAVRTVPHFVLRYVVRRLPPLGRLVPVLSVRHRILLRAPLPQAKQVRGRVYVRHVGAAVLARITRIDDERRNEALHDRQIC